MSAQSRKYVSELVFFPEKAEWLADLEAELFAFPGGRNDPFRRPLSTGAPR